MKPENAGVAQRAGNSHTRNFPFERPDAEYGAPAVAGITAVEALNYRHGGDMGSTGVGSQSGMPGSVTRKTNRSALNADDSNYALAA